jgi:cytochrome c-type protein NapC
LSLRTLWQTFRSPTGRYALGTLLVAGIVLGAVGVVGFEVSMEATNTDQFCISCHELEENAYAEFLGTSHDSNASGVSATCSDCHVPKELFPKLWRKIKAATEVYHHFKGTISTPEKYDAYRMTMATKTWTYMNSVDSRECRNCHDDSRWDLAAQSEKARKYHEGPLSNGKTCIDCHKGLAHKLPPGIADDEQIEGIDF